MFLFYQYSSVSHLGRVVRQFSSRSRAIELIVPRDEFSSIAIELTFVTLGRGFEEAGSVYLDIGDSWDKDFFNPITSLYFCITGLCYSCV